MKPFRTLDTCFNGINIKIIFLIDQNPVSNSCFIICTLDKWCLGGNNGHVLLRFLYDVSFESQWVMVRSV